MSHHMYAFMPRHERILGTRYITFLESSVNLVKGFLSIGLSTTPQRGC